jgi:hypothetical protein
MWGYWCAFGADRALPAPWVSAFCRTTAPQLHAFTTRQLGVLLKALLLLRAAPDRLLLEQVSDAIDLRAACLPRGELAMVSASLLGLQQLAVCRLPAACTPTQTSQALAARVCTHQPAVPAAEAQDTRQDRPTLSCVL